MIKLLFLQLVSTTRAQIAFLAFTPSGVQQEGFNVNVVKGSLLPTAVQIWVNDYCLKSDLKFPILLL